MAIALFPLLDGETIGSNLGRYGEFMGLETTVPLRRRLFGYACRPDTRLPSGLTYLAEQTRDYWNLRPEDIVNFHTEFRYATMMASQEIRRKLLEILLAPRVRHETRIRPRSPEGERISSLRYCEECLKECVDNHQTPYWKIDHQLPGVYCCATHGCILKSVRRRSSERYVDQAVMRLIQASDDKILREVSPAEKLAIEDIARRSAQQRAEGGLGKSAKEYRELFREVGFWRAGYQLRRKPVISAWFDYFGREYSYITKTNANRILHWIELVATGSWGCDCPHPFMSIAVTSLLEHLAELPGSHFPWPGCSDSKFSGGKETFAPDAGAYSCRGALHRSADSLEFVPMKKGGWKLVCTCGVSYRLLKTIQGDGAQLSPMSYGDRYRKRFLALIARGETVWAAGRELRVDCPTAYRWADREAVSNGDSLPVAEIGRLRAIWCQLIKNVPSRRRITSAAEADPTTYRTLLKYDRKWLRAFNQRHRATGAERFSSSKWPTADEIREAQRGLMLAEPPIMVTRSAILERAGFPCAYFGRNRIYWGVLTDAAECRPAYLERVISWLARLASEQRLDDCEEALRSAGLLRRSFSREQRKKIREIERTSLADVRPSKER